MELVTAFARESKLKAALAEIKGQFDYILIDCPPSLGHADDQRFECCR